MSTCATSAASTKSRRDFLALLAGSALLHACGGGSFDLPETGGGSPRLASRPGAPSQGVTPGTIQITASNPNDGFLVVPPSYDPARKTPLMVALHGAGEGAVGSLGLMGPYASSRGCLLLAVGARGVSWDVLTYRYSYDVTFIDGALKWAFDRCNVDPARVTLEGFSDGASYALGLGLGNGDLFSRIIAFSPGFVPRSDVATVGKPSLFVSHGRQDPILSIDGASRVIVPDLKGHGYDVTYVEFDGGHAAPAVIINQAIDWMLA